MKKLLAIVARYTSVLLMACLLLTASTLVMAGNQKDEKEQMALPEGCAVLVQYLKDIR